MFSYYYFKYSFIPASRKESNEEWHQADTRNKDRGQG